MGSQVVIIPTTLPSFPWDVGDQLDAVPLNNAFIGLQQQIDNLVFQVNHLTGQVQTNNLGFGLTVNFGGNSSPTEGPYELMATAPYDFTIGTMEFSVGDSGGSFVVTLTNNGIPIDGLSDILVNQFGRQSVTAGSGNAILRGSELKMFITELVGIPTNSWIQLNGLSNNIPTIIGSSTGIAVGAAASFALGAGLTAGQAIVHAGGVASSNVFAMAADQAAGFAFGVATSHMVGVQVSLGNITGSAHGNSTAIATGASSVPFPTLVLDDPSVGILNQNPLG